MVFDTYKTQTLKAATRTRRGKGIRRKVQDDSIAPTNWHAFLRLDENKTELLNYLSKEMILSSSDDFVVTCAYDMNCVTNNGQLPSSFISPCNHEEADTRVFLHVNDVSLQGQKKIVVRTRTSISTVRTTIFFWPCNDTSFT